MRRPLSRLLALDVTDRRIAVRAVVWLLGIDIALRVLGFQRVARGAPTLQRNRVAVTAGDIARARRYAHWLAVVGRHHIARGRCLQRSLALHYWLRREGLPGELWIGVRKEGEALLGHAWVTLDGHLVTDAPEVVARFAPLVAARSGGLGCDDAPAALSPSARSRTMIGSLRWR